MRSKYLIGFSIAATMAVSVSTVYAGTVHYTVRSGDSLYSIAEQYDTSVSSIMSLNHLSSNLIHPGQSLLVDDSSASSSTSVHTSSSTSSSTSYTVQSGDSLWAISQKLGVSVSNIEAWNGLSSTSVLHPGEHLKVEGSGVTTLSSRSGSPDTSLDASALGFTVSDYAKQFLGAPYVWGGSSPSGFDCSGFVQYVFAHFGISLPRTSYGQYSMGSGVSESELEPGDIVFFDSDGDGASHDGVYIGNGQFINAASTDVEIDDISSDYWGSHYLGARRVSG